MLCQRRRDEEDELLMRNYLSEGDLISVYFYVLNCNDMQLESEFLNFL